MKILLVIPALGPVYGGPSKIAVNFAAALGRRGLHADLVSTNANGATDLDVPLGCWLERPHHREKYFSRWRPGGEFKVSLPLLRWLWRHAGDYDFVHASSIFNFTLLANAWACRHRRVPYLVCPQGMLEPWALAYKAWKKRAYFRFLERPALRRAAAIQALNAGEAANIDALRLGPPTVVIPNGVDPADDAGGADREPLSRRFPETRGKRLILFLHRIDPKKGLDLLAAAFALVRSRHPAAHLVVAGPDNTDFLPTARGYFSSAGCADAVTFTGLLAGAEKRAALAAASVFVAPSYSEGFSMSILEAMISGLPAVITIGCNFPEAGEADAALVVEPRTEAFASAMESLLENPPGALAMGQRARRFVLANYTWDRIAARFETLFCALLAGEPLAAARGDEAVPVS